VHQSPSVTTTIISVLRGSRYRLLDALSPRHQCRGARAHVAIQGGRRCDLNHCCAAILQGGFHRYNRERSEIMRKTAAAKGCTGSCACSRAWHLWSATICTAIIDAMPAWTCIALAASPSLAIDIRTIERHPLTSVGSLVLRFQCSVYSGSMLTLVITGLRGVRPALKRRSGIASVIS
jgi:hypothetical protein